MPTSENATLQRIQREISEVMEREKELRSLQNGNNINLNNNNNNENEKVEINDDVEKDKPIQTSTPKTRPILSHSKSLGAYSNGTTTNTTLRKFTPNPAAKGVMHKFIKSRGKLTAASLMSSTNSNSTPISNQTSTPSPTAQIWNIPDTFEPPKVMDPSQCVRKGYVPVEEKLRKELEDLHLREMELRSERRKSQPDFSSLVEIEPPPQMGDSGMKKARSMAQLYNPEEFNNFSPSNLKAARSLAELCDTNEEELDAPGSHFLINRWEEMIQKNQGVRS